MADEEKKRPVVASLVFAAISAMVLSPLYPIALGFKGLAGWRGRPDRGPHRREGGAEHMSTRYPGTLEASHCDLEDGEALPRSSGDVALPWVDADGR